MLVVMNNKGPVLVLLLVAVGLGIALVVVNKQAADRAKEDAYNLTVSSNNAVSYQKRLTESETVNQTLETNLGATRADFSNKLSVAESNLRSAEASLEKAVAEAKAEARAVADSNAIVLAQRDQKISDLENQNGALDKQSAALRVAITNLDTRIAATQEKLAKSEGDRAFLTKELKLLKAEKADLEKRFNNLADVSEQLRKLKMEAAVDHRLDRQRRSIDATFKESGAELALHPMPSNGPPESSGPKVELREHGGANIQLPPSTNAPPK
jgi:chromosome segregation ATPase